MLSAELQNLAQPFQKRAGLRSTTHGLTPCRCRPCTLSLGAATCAGLPPDMRPLGGGVTAAAAAMAPAAPMAVDARSHLISGVRSPGVRSFARSLESLSPERGASSPQLLQPAAARQQPLLMVTTSER